MRKHNNFVREDLKFLEKEDRDYYSIEIVKKDSHYNGVIFTIGKIQFKEDKDHKNCTMAFDYHIEEVPVGHKKELLEYSDTFKNYVGDIIIAILLDFDYDRENDTQ